MEPSTTTRQRLEETARDPSTGKARVRVGAQRDRDIAGGEHRSDVLRFRTGLYAALGIWLVFFLHDLVAASVVGSGSLLLFWGIRAALVPPGLASLIRLRAEPPPSPRLLRIMDVGLYAAGSYGIALMAAVHGGIGSLYATGIIILLAGRGAFTAQSWKAGPFRFSVAAAAAGSCVNWSST